MNYFAYASSMNFEQMRRICGWHFHLLGMAELPDFEMGLDLRGFTNIREKKGEKVYGVLYDIDQHCLETLDKFEDYPNVFGRQEVMVIHDGKQKTAWVYIQPAEQFGGTEVKPDFFRRVIAAAEENHLPGEWIKKLKAYIGE